MKRFTFLVTLLFLVSIALHADVINPDVNGDGSADIIDVTSLIDFLLRGDSSYMVVTNVKSYGAVGNGIADDTEALEMAFEQAYENGVPVMLPAGTYLIRRPLTLRDNMEVFGLGETIIKKKAAATTTLTAVLSAGDSVLYVKSTSGFSIGDALTISAMASSYPSARNCSVGIITAINPKNGTITFHSAYNTIKPGAVKDHASGCYVTNSHALLRSWGMLYSAENVKIHDLILDGNRQSGEFGDWHNGCIHLDATTGTVNGIPYKYAASNLTCRDLTILNSPYDGISDQSSGSGSFERIYISNPAMHGIHLGTYYDGATISACEIEGTVGGAGVFWCQGVQNVIVKGNTFRNCLKGCSDSEYGTSAMKSIVSSNIFIGCKSYVFDFSHSGTGGNIMFTENLIESQRGMVGKITSEDNISITNNIISDFSSTPSCLFSLSRSSNVVLRGNIAPSGITPYKSAPTGLIDESNSWNVQ